MSQTDPFHLRRWHENLDTFGLEDKVRNMLKSKLQHMFESSTWFPPNYFMIHRWAGKQQLIWNSQYVKYDLSNTIHSDSLEC